MEEQKELKLAEGWEPVVIEEKDVKGFDEPITGKYECEIKDVVMKIIKTKAGKEMEIISLKLQCVNDISGNSSMRRLLDKTYYMGVSEYSDDEELGFKRFLTDLASSGLYEPSMRDYDRRREIVLGLKETIVGCPVYISAYAKSGKQQIRIYAKDREKSSTPVIKGVF